MLAAHWADQHPAETLYGIPVGLPGRERVVMLGGEGTPEVAEFAAAELGVSLHQHPHAARNLIADALDVRHRFPGLWHLVTDEQALEVWVARKIAAATRRAESTPGRGDRRPAGRGRSQPAADPAAARWWRRWSSRPTTPAPTRPERRP